MEGNPKSTKVGGGPDLVWTAPAGDTTYNVYRGTGSGAESLLASGLTATNYTDTTVTNGVTYYYYVSAEVSAQPGYATTSFAFVSCMLSNQPVAYWRLDELNGITALDSAGGHNGTYGSAVTLGVPGPQPPDFLGFETDNTAVQLANGINNSWVTIPALNLNTNTVTITAWIYPVGTQAPYTGVMFLPERRHGRGNEL